MSDMESDSWLGFSFQTDALSKRVVASSLLCSKTIIITSIDLFIAFYYLWSEEYSLYILVS